MKKKIHFLLAAVFILTACTTKAEEPTPAPTAVPTTPSGVLLNDPTLFWKEIRDEVSGYGIAVPCWWQVKAIPVETEGNLSSIAIRNYDDNFFKEYSENGDWIGGVPPQGVVVMSVTVATTSPDLSAEDSYLQYTEPGTVEVIAAQEKQVGEVTYTIVSLKSTTDASRPALNVFINRLSPETVLIVNAYPPEAIVYDDFQIILSTLVSADETIAPPLVMPQEPLGSMICPY
ncbi:MAG: hypothetical protein JNK32_01930 [Anaerolineales bacterium]|nr:hypothetical protein [Anaerolineales bacterium]